MISSPAWIVYQPLIVGLGAVVLATIGNTLLEWYRQNLQDRREAKSIRVAFAEELRTHRIMYADAWSVDDKSEGKSTLLVPIDPFYPVYDNLIGKIGLLEPDQVSAVLKAYSYLMLSPKNLIHMGQLKKNEFASFVEVAPRFKPVLRNMYRDTVSVIDDALRTLGS